jgi:Protein of unknown function (DUF2752)
MRLVWRKLAPGEFDYELVWLAVSVAAAVGGAIWLRLGLPMPHCPFLAITGYPCLTCGATRCSIALLHGNLAAAWLWNPLAFATLCALALYDLYAAIVLLGGLPRARLVDWTARQKTAVRIGVVALIIVNWVYLLSHRGRF